MQFPTTAITLHSIQFAALLGDLQHKTDVYIARQSFDKTVSCLFSNYEQGKYLLDNHPSLVPSGHWSDHSLGTFFEYYYYSNLTFRLDYLHAQSELVCS
jgi:hypothetical protein